MFKRLLAYSLFVFGFIVVTFFRKYSGTIIPYPFLFWLIGLISFFSGLALLRWIPSTKEQKENKQLKELIKEIKLTGEKIKVDFSKCDIKENDYFEEIENYDSGNYFTTFDIERNIQALNSLTDPKRNVGNVEVKQTVLIFRNEYHGKIEKFVSRILHLDKMTLLFKLEAQKESTLYVDKQNRLKYYFDLEFLEI